MPDELMKCFLEMLVECMDGISDSLNVLLQYYHVAVSEKSEYPEEDKE